MKNIFTSVSVWLLCSVMCYGQLVITELSYNPPEANTDSLEYLEIYNAGDSPLNLKKYRFSQGIEFTFPDTTINAGQYITLSVKAASFLTAYGFQTMQWTTGALNNGGEVIALVDSLGAPVISVDLKDVAPWPTALDGTDGNGKSIEICNPLADPNNGGNWKVSVNDLGFQINGKQVFGTPGAENTIPACAQEPDVIVELSSNTFNPQHITIETGQTVRWINTGGHHNINGKQSSFPSNPESFDNGPASDLFWTFDFTFNTQGFYDYKCDIHGAQGMTGTVTVNDPVVTEVYPLRSIQDMTTTKLDGVLDSLNVNCTLTGIVYGVNLRPGGLQFTIIDNQNNGIGVFNNSGNYDYTVNEGDEVEVKGQVTQFNGFAQIVVTAVRKLSEGNSLVTPANISAFEENDESSLVTMSNLSFVDPSEWTGMGAGFNVTMTNGTDNFTIRIDNDIDAYSAPIPNSSPVWSVTGLLGQFDSSLPYTEGYQLLPRYLVDFSPAGGAEDESLDNDLQVTPNPVTNILTIVTDSNPELILVYDGKGNLKQKITGSLEIDMSSFASGFYVIKLVAGQKSNTIKVMKL
ncbi:MAG: lamin tail domain-containing protein [Saprospiraceae bacterium]|nr:lamin tail domain-containing protein [Saprospiraceae bacterium]